MTSENEPTIQDVVDTGMSPDRIRQVVNDIAKGVRTRADRHHEDEWRLQQDIHTSLKRIAEALDYLVALSKFHVPQK